MITVIKYNVCDVGLTGGMRMSDGLGPPGLRYLGEQRLTLGARRTVAVPSDRCGRFLWCESTSLLVVGEGPRGRWSCRVGPGELLLLCPAERAWVTSLSERASELRLLHFEAGEEGHGRGLARGIPPVPVRIPGFEPALQALAAAGGSGAPAGGRVPEPDTAALIRFFRTQAHLYELMAAYLGGARRRPGPFSVLGYAEQVRSQMAAHSERDYSIELIARSSGVSPHRFYQAFRLLTGLTPHKYLSALRLRKALRLLAGDSRSVAEVAHAVGYGDEFYFSRVFKRELGIAPSAFVRQVRSRPRVEAAPGDLAIFGLAAPPEGGGPGGGSQGGFRGPAGEGEDARGTAWSRGPLEGEDPPGAAWSRRVERLGEALGLESVAAHWVSLMERRLCHLKSLVRSAFAEAPFVVVGVDGAGYRVFGTRHPEVGDLLYGAAGFTPCEAVRGLRELRVAALAEVAALGCPRAVFLVEGGDRPSLPADWAEAVGHEGARCLVAGWPGEVDATACERLVEQLTLALLEPEFARDTWG